MARIRPAGSKSPLVSAFTPPQELRYPRVVSHRAYPTSHKRPESPGYAELRGRDSNPDYLIQSQASYH